MITVGLNLLVCVLALVLPVLSGSFHLARADQEENADAAIIFCLHISGSTLILMIIVSIAGRLGVGSIAPLRWYAVLVLVMAVGSFLVGGPDGRRRQLVGLRRILRECVVPLIVMAVCLVPALLVVRSSGNRFGFATLFNGDIANYSLVADNVAQSGFSDSTHVLNANYGEFASQTSSGGTAIINYISALTGLRSWQVLMAAMGYTILLAFVTLREVTKSIWRPSDTGSQLAAASVAVMIPLSSLLVGQYFLNHLLGIAACALALAAIIALARNGSPSIITSATMTVGLALAIYSNGTFGLPLVVACGVIVPMVHYLSGTRQSPETWSLRRRMVRLVICVVSSVVIAAPALSAAVDTIRSQSSAQVGYPLDHLGAFGALVWPNWIVAEWQQYRLSSYWQAGSWVLTLLISVVLLHRSTRRFDRRIALLAMCGAMVAGAIAVAVWGEGRYQTWKLWAFLLPIDVVIVLPALWSLKGDHRGVGRMVGLVAVGIAATAPMATWTSEVWAPSVDQAAQASLVASLRTIDQWNLDVVNVNLHPYFETMVAGTVLEDTRVALTSPSYVSGPLTIESTCTFTKTSLVADPSQGIQLVGDYILMPLPARCGVNLPWPG